MNEIRKTRGLLLVLCFAVIGTMKADPGNPNIDMKGFLKVAAEAATYRENHRVSEEEFLRMSLSSEPLFWTPAVRQSSICFT